MLIPSSYISGGETHWCLHHGQFILAVPLMVNQLNYYNLQAIHM